jgi:hypothetical protein
VGCSVGWAGSVGFCSEPAVSYRQAAQPSASSLESQLQQLTITVPSELGRYVEERSAQEGVKKSAMVSRILEADRERYMDELLREGYEEMTEHDRKLHKEFEHVDRESSWPEYQEQE